MQITPILQPTVSFDVPKDITMKIATILKSAEARGITRFANRLDHSMDMTACHANGCPLDFDKLAGFDDFNLSHDIWGINRHLNRKTGELGGFFRPRCSAPDNN